MPDSLGDRMKGYENVSRIYLPRRLPVIIRIDGRAFHTFTRGFVKPFDNVLHKAMWRTAEELCKQIAGVKLAYIQSDEISLLLTNDDTIETQPWFDNNLQKLVSISASIATLEFNKALSHETEAFRVKLLEETYCEDQWVQERTYHDALWNAQFDARAFVLPPSEVINYFIWRQQDATRNSIQIVAQSLYSHKELMNKNTAQMQDMIHEKGVNWNDYPTYYKRGLCVIKQPSITEVTVYADEKEIATIIRHQWKQDDNIPIFTKDREYIERWLKHDDA